MFASVLDDDFDEDFFLEDVVSSHPTCPNPEQPPKRQSFQLKPEKTNEIKVDNDGLPPCTPDLFGSPEEDSDELSDEDLLLSAVLQVEGSNLKDTSQAGRSCQSSQQEYTVIGQFHDNIAKTPHASCPVFKKPFVKPPEPSSQFNPLPSVNSQNIGISRGSNESRQCDQTSLVKRESCATNSQTQTTCGTVSQNSRASEERDSRSKPSVPFPRTIYPTCGSAVLTNSTLENCPAAAAKPYVKAQKFNVPYPPEKQSLVESNKRISLTPEVISSTPRAAKEADAQSAVCTPTKNTSTPSLTSSMKRKRKFPGPAGVLPKLNSTASLAALTNFRPVSPEEKKVQQPDAPVPSSQNWEEKFEDSPWSMMMGELELQAKRLLPEFSITRLLQKAGRKQLPSAKVPIACVMIEQITPTNCDASAIFRDRTGTMKGTIHRNLMKDYSEELQVGTVLVLRQCGVFSPTSRTHYLNVTPNNIVRMYLPGLDGQTDCKKLGQFQAQDFEISQGSGSVTRLRVQQKLNTKDLSSRQQQPTSSCVRDVNHVKDGRTQPSSLMTSHAASSSRNTAMFHTHVMLSPTRSCDNSVVITPRTTLCAPVCHEQTKQIPDGKKFTFKVKSKSSESSPLTRAEYKPPVDVGINPSEDTSTHTDEACMSDDGLENLLNDIMADDFNS